MEKFKKIEDDDIMIEVTMLDERSVEEMGSDDGGVMRDTLSEFWESFYSMCCNGEAVKYPRLKHTLHEEDWIAICRILVFGYKACGYYPIKLATSFMLNCFGRSVSEETVLNDFMNSTCDRDLIINAKEGRLEEFDDLIDFLDDYECTVVPNEKNVINVLNEIAHKEIIQKPAYISKCWKPILLQQVFLLPEEIELICVKLKPSCKRVLEMLTFDDDPQAKGELLTIRSLKRYVKTLDENVLTKFVRFCTGADVLVVDKIFVRILKNSQSDFQRRPVAHTCGAVLELPPGYELVDLKHEFNNILSSNVLYMDFV